MKTMTRSELTAMIIAAYPAVPLAMRDGQSCRGQSLDAGNVRGPLTWHVSTDRVLTLAEELGGLAVED